MAKIARSICLTIPSRAAEFQKILDFHNRSSLPLVKFNGVVGSTLNSRTIIEYSKFLHKSFKFNISAKRARLAIAISHISIWHSLREYGDSYSLILEDDLILTDSIIEQTNLALTQINFDWDILFIGHSGKLKGTKKEGFVIAQRGHFPNTNHGMFAYIINPASLNKVLNTVGKLTKVQHIDWILREKYGKEIRAVYCEPSIILHNNKVASFRKKLDRI
jgi:GR25 family glycosyltransferase involved in LPS biosynthesis